MKDEYGWKIGKWNSKISIMWRNKQILRWYGIKYFDNYNELCFGRLTIRVRKHKRDGIYLFREVYK